MTTAADPLEADSPMQGDEPHTGRKICGAATRTCTCGHHRKSHVGGTGACGECLAPGDPCLKFRPLPCEDDKVMPNGRCRRHGGKTPGGIASPNFKTGRWSKHLPAKALGGNFRAAYHDRTLMQLRQDAALVDALITSYTSSLKDTGRPLTLPQQERVLALIEQRRKLVESEARRLRDLAQVVPIEQYRTALGILFRIIQEHLGENPRAMMDVQTAARRLLLGKGQVRDDGDE